MADEKRDARENGLPRAEWDRFWDSRQTIEDVYSNDKRVIEALRSVLDPRGKTILEVGAGSGRDSIELAKAGARLIVLDYSLNSLSLVKQESSGSKNVELVCADACLLPFRNGSLDAAFHQGLLEHFKDPSLLMAEQNRVLKEGGIVLVDVPQKFHLYTIVKHILMALGLWLVSWETQYTVGGLENVLRANGFSPVSAYGDWMVPGLFYRGTRYLLMRLRIARLPLYPRGIPVVTAVSESFRRWFRKKKVSYYTYFVIGVIARKECRCPR
ncbi:MAG: class I SAM-dependent methyltransferase [Candidatus Eisenbacteria bacterium]|nr:class I SAM-dependent methyltransferase [Candidatus Eisenbacteria bacterium]